MKPQDRSACVIRSISSAGSRPEEARIVIPRSSGVSLDHERAYEPVNHPARYYEAVEEGEVELQYREFQGEPDTPAERKEKLMQEIPDAVCTHLQLPCPWEPCCVVSDVG